MALSQLRKTNTYEGYIWAQYGKIIGCNCDTQTQDGLRIVMRVISELKMVQ